MGVNWKEMENVLRLYAADMAVNGAKGRDYKKMAAFFGKGATYDTIEGKCRSIRKIAAMLEEEYNKTNGEASPAPNTNGEAGSQASIASTTATPKKPKAAPNGVTTPRANKKNGEEKVLSGRVVKNSRKAKDNAKDKLVKQEEDSAGDADLEMDAEVVAGELGLDGNFEFLGMDVGPDVMEV
ncbi:MAG: hypothetical protein Q9174_004896 [Haloplaca sp. 1 TL-2023]